MPTITFAHLDAMMRIVREPAPPTTPADVRAGTGEAEVVNEAEVAGESAADARPDARPNDVRDARGATRAAQLDARYDGN